MIKGPSRRIRSHPTRKATAPISLVEDDLDYCSPYPCGVCGRNFQSRSALATHPHERKATT